MHKYENIVIRIMKNNNQVKWEPMWKATPHAFGRIWPLPACSIYLSKMKSPTNHIKWTKLEWLNSLQQLISETVCL
ncbi:Uncharacterized protein TCM_020830 [Theobroma cacao]|uniref:Uncharacterized protein n=1 Tax=Theobroma cacao TaxID=3641 RepID=A0A061EM93_THECC|nr:Uncharacterized protein TCM_020830 [Theobroma cacao]